MKYCDELLIAHRKFILEIIFRVEHKAIERMERILGLPKKTVSILAAYY
jgi:hypothetical protein